MQWVPALSWLKTYRADDGVADLTAGTITAILLVPQAMAYAQLAGLPPEVGLYSSIVPIFLYAAFGTSTTLAVGPVAVAALMVASALEPLAAPGSVAYIAGAVFLAAASGLILLTMGVARLGAAANLLSHPVMSGFTSAAAIVIAFSQVKYFLGLDLPSGLRLDQLLLTVVTQMDAINATTLILGLISVGLLWFFRNHLARLLQKAGVAAKIAQIMARLGPLVLVGVLTAISGDMNLEAARDVAVVGTIPQGLPAIALPNLAFFQDLIGAAFLIALVGFVESVAVAKALAARRREKIDINQELVGLGLANIGAGFTAGAPVCGGFARSVVNFEAGARTQMAAIVTALIILVTVLAFTSLFYHLPQAVLSAIIVVSVLTLVDFSVLKRCWTYDKTDAVSWLATFAAVLALGVELGILSGIVISVGLFLWRTARPHVAIVGRVRDTQQFRNTARHNVDTAPHLIAIRIDESLYFANASHLERTILDAVADNVDVTDILLIFSAVNALDGSALETLEALHDELREGGVKLSLAEIKGPVMDKLERTGFPDHVGRENIYLSTHRAFQVLVDERRTDMEYHI
ncbi:MAG: SulP family inorganic anion transporter [Alphaproteobacteria bacterium]